MLAVLAAPTGVLEVIAGHIYLFGKKSFVSGTYVHPHLGDIISPQSH